MKYFIIFAFVSFACGKVVQEEKDQPVYEEIEILQPISDETLDSEIEIINTKISKPNFEETIESKYDVYPQDKYEKNDDLFVSPENPGVSISWTCVLKTIMSLVQCIKDVNNESGIEMLGHESGLDKSIADCINEGVININSCLIEGSLRNGASSKLRGLDKSIADCINEGVININSCLIEGSLRNGASSKLREIVQEKLVMADNMAIIMKALDILKDIKVNDKYLFDVVTREEFVKFVSDYVIAQANKQRN